MKTSTLLAVLLIALLAHPAPAQQLPVFIARVYPGLDAIPSRRTRTQRAMAWTISRRPRDFS